MGVNAGFTGAVNAGIQKSNAEYIVLLNDDATASPDWLDQLVNTQQQTQADMVASTIYLGGSGTIDSQGFTFYWRGKAYPLLQKRGTSHLKSEQAGCLNKKKNIPHLSGEGDHWLNNQQFFTSNTPKFFREPFGPDAAACLYTRKLFDTVGLFDDRFFAYLEDVDLALRARKAGMYCALAKDGVAYHHKHATSGAFPRFKATQDMKNWWRIVLYTYPKKSWRKFWPQILLERGRNLSGWMKSLALAQKAKTKYTTR